MEAKTVLIFSRCKGGGMFINENRTFFGECESNLYLGLLLYLNSQ